jgi:hypothetical protein
LLGGGWGGMDHLNRALCALLDSDDTRARSTSSFPPSSTENFTDGIISIFLQEAKVLN